MKLSSNRDFRVWVTGTTADSLGNSIVTLAIPLATLSTVGSAAGAGLLGSVYGVSFAAFVLLGGVLVDRIDRRKAMMAKGIVSAVLWTICAFLVQAGATSLWLLGALLFLAGVNRAMFGSADNAAVRSIVPPAELPRVQGVVQAREAAIELGGAPLGGVLIGLALGAPFAVAAACGVVLGCSAVLIERDLRPRTLDRTPPVHARIDAIRSVPRDLAEGMKFVLEDRLIRVAVAIISVVNLSIALTLQLATLSFASDGVPPIRIAVLYSVAAGAMLGGAVVSGRLVSRVPNGVLIVSSLGVVGAALAAISLFPQITFVTVALAAVGLVVPTMSAVLQGYVASATPVDRQGRVISLMTLLSLGLAALAPVVAGSLVTSGGVQVGYAVAAVIALGCASVAALARDVRTLGLPETWPSSGLDGKA